MVSTRVVKTGMAHRGGRDRATGHKAFRRRQRNFAPLASVLGLRSWAEDEVDGRTLRYARSSCAAWCAPSPASRADGPARLITLAAYLVVRRNHCSRSRCSTTVSSWRQQQPLMTCSLASTVAQSGHQFNLALLAEGKAVLQHAQEKPLRPTVVVGQAGSDLGLPVIAQAQAAHLAAHVGYVLERPLSGRGLVFESGVFRREVRRHPSPWMKDVVALHPHVRGQGIADGVVADMAHVELARGIGQHLQDVILWLAAVGRLGTIELGICIPELLPTHFNFRGIVSVGQGCGSFTTGTGFVGDGRTGASCLIVNGTARVFAGLRRAGVARVFRVLEKHAH